MVRKGNGAQRSAVLLEEIHFEVRKIAEGHDTLARGINRLEERFGEFGQRLATVEQVLSQHAVRFDQLDARMEDLDGRMEQLNVRMEVLDGRMGQLVMRFDVHVQAHAS